MHEAQRDKDRAVTGSQTAATQQTLRTRLRSRIVEPGDTRAAEAFHRRYRRLYIADKVVAAIVELADSWNHDARAAAAAFDVKRQDWELHGGYLETVPIDDFRRWLRSDSYVLVEVAASRSLEGVAFEAIAQRLLRIPATDWVVPLLDGPDDEISDPDRYEALLRDGPSAAALGDYVGVLREWAGCRAAAEARYVGMLELIRRNSTRPPAARLRNVVGLIFAVQGVDVLGGTDGRTIVRSIRLSDLGQREIANHASLRASGTSRRTAAHLIGKRKAGPGIPVAIGPARFALRVDWYYIVYILDEVRAA
jgi:hypothetical protein